MASKSRPTVVQTRFVGSSIPATLAVRLDRVAEARDRSLAYEIRRAIEAHVEALEQELERDAAS